ncbi:GNAT family N-acetyltransferase [Xylanimonas sp. McL0601]|uniref:GNAT family N-acetyltransferase n=1 Tax=Xylanimonas sp. McL0601 TaxID=3414739 RepID=UPI003CF20D58
MTSAPSVRPLAPADWPAVERIFREGIATGHATFEAAPPTWDEFDAGKLPGLRLVATLGDDVVGWVSASAVSSRAVYRGVVEHSVYVADAARGHGVGGLLLDAFLAVAHDHGVWTVQSAVFPENVASLRLHEAHGFRTVGRRERIGLMTYGPFAGTWRDTVLIEHRRAER